MSAILYYITGHGYGHAVRSAQVLRSLLKTQPSVALHARTTAPQWLFPKPVSYSRQTIDIGIVQRDSLDMDLAATLNAGRELFAKAETLIETELEFIAAQRIDLIVADIAPLAFAIAARAGIPSVAITNFSWDVIYHAYVDSYPGFAPLIGQIAQCYGKATTLLELPYPCPMPAFAHREAIPWIARTVKFTKASARAYFGLPPDAKIVLLSFGGLGLERLPWNQLRRQSDLFFVATGDSKRQDGNLLILPDAQRHYENLVRAVDVMVTKPGYGIVADALAQRVPVLYTDRGDFPEYPFLVRALNECASAEYLPQSELLAGNIAGYVDRLLGKPPNWPEVALDGAQVAAEKILSRLG